MAFGVFGFYNGIMMFWTLQLWLFGFIDFSILGLVNGTMDLIVACVFIVSFNASINGCEGQILSKCGIRGIIHVIDYQRMYISMLLFFTFVKSIVSFTLKVCVCMFVLQVLHHVAKVCVKHKISAFLTPWHGSLPLTPLEIIKGGWGGVSQLITHSHFLALCFLCYIFCCRQLSYLSF
jgi:hypothetical protein